MWGTVDFRRASRGKWCCKHYWLYRAFTVLSANLSAAAQAAHIGVQYDGIERITCKQRWRSINANSARFSQGVSGSPIASVTSQGGTSAPIVPSTSIHQLAPNAVIQQQGSPTALFGSEGYRNEAFFHIAHEIFAASDHQPVGTQVIEASKMRRFRELGGKSIPPYYETHVLPLYYQTIGAQCVGTNVLSWECWNTFLAHKILSGPDEMFAQLSFVLRGLNLRLPWPLVRTYFPAYAYPDAAARELQFQQGIRNLAGAIGGGHIQQRYSMGSGSNVVRRGSMSGLLGNNFSCN
ncbi:hypothetical protein C8R43DRAFT_564003 [Mycena crocata]|nr:hypothetical protein C8R43DRAFT_564003 [Mycena crocata]